MEKVALIKPMKIAVNESDNESNIGNDHCEWKRQRQMHILYKSWEWQLPSMHFDYKATDSGNWYR